MNQKHMTRAERRADNVRRRLGGLPIYWEHVYRAVSGQIITTTDNPPMVIEHVGMEEIGQGVTIHTPNMVCLDPNCNLPHGQDALAWQTYQDPAKAESAGNPDCKASATIVVDPAKPGSDMTAMVFIDEASDVTPEAAAGLQRMADAIKRDEIKLPGVESVHSGPTIRDLGKLSGLDLAQAIEDL